MKVREGRGGGERRAEEKRKGRRRRCMEEAEEEEGGGGRRRKSKRGLPINNVDYRVTNLRHKFQVTRHASG